MQEEVTQKTVTFCIRATKITADLLKKVLVAYLRHQKQKSVEKKAQKNQPKQGKVTTRAKSLRFIWYFSRDVIRMPSMLLSVSFPRNRFKKRISLPFISVLQLTGQ